MTAPNGDLSLDQLPRGAMARVLRFDSESERRILKLENLGLLPGSILRLIQKRPSLVIEVGGTTLALDRDLARLIRVQKAS